MSLTDEERKTLVALELKKARDTYEEIGILTAANRWSGAANRLYYAVFHAVSALLINDGLQVNSHSVYDVEPEELLSRIEPAKQLIDEIEQLINK